MINEILTLLYERGISVAGAVSLSDCVIKRGYKLERAGLSDFENLTAIIMAVPYLSPTKCKNLSSYAVSRDYHGYFAQFFDEFLPMLRSKYPNNRFIGFTDDSPIIETDAAAKAGLGVIGENHMLITEKYSSYVFLGEIITDVHADISPSPVLHCHGCGACKKACPESKYGVCLSALTQKKGELSQEEQEAILSHGSVWGCDICQEVCPYTKKAIKAGTIYTDIDYFKKELIPILTLEDIDKMSDTEFSQRAYSWRGKAVISRNLTLMENSKKSD